MTLRSIRWFHRPRNCGDISLIEVWACKRSHYRKKIAAAFGTPLLSHNALAAA
jgi:hypothetical protein